MTNYVCVYYVCLSEAAILKEAGWVGAGSIPADRSWEHFGDANLVFYIGLFTHVVIGFEERFSLGREEQTNNLV